MEETIITEVQKFGALINWPFVFTFLMVAYTAKKIIQTKTFSSSMAPPRTWKISFITGVFLIILFFALSEEYTLKEILRYIMSMAFTMFVMWDGLKKWAVIFNKKTDGRNSN